MFQAIALVQKLAKTGQLDPIYFNQCMAALFRIDSENSESVFGGVEHLSLGLTSIETQMTGITQSHNIEFTRYAVGIMHLQRQLSKSKALLDKLQQSILALKNEFPEADYANQHLVAAIAKLYVDTISTLHPRIQVKGEKAYLSNPGNPEKIRALLLTAIRACVLWRQLGGTRLGLLVNRKKYIAASKKLIAQVDHRVST